MYNNLLCYITIEIINPNWLTYTGPDDCSCQRNIECSIEGKFAEGSIV